MWGGNKAVVIFTKTRTSHAGSQQLVTGKLEKFLWFLPEPSKVIQPTQVQENLRSSVVGTGCLLYQKENYDAII